MSALPAEAFVLRRQSTQFRPAIDVQHLMSRGQEFSKLIDRHALLSSQHQTAFAESRFEVLMQQRGEMRHFGIDQTFIAANQRSKVQRRIVDAQLITTPQNSLRYLDHRAFSDRK